jgi:pyruvate formate lyase activating enzyme
MDFSRREFLKTIATGACVLSSDLTALAENATPSSNITAGRGKYIFFEKEAMFYEKLKENEIKCKLCPKECEIGDRERGWCGVRENREGTYYTLVYGNPCSINPDPIEKKPFFHFLPGTLAFSIATAGCNLNCKFCQNWEISQFRPEETKNYRLPPMEVVKEARQCECRTIAYTYSEPTIFYEYMLDTAKLGRKAGMKSVVVSAGFINPDPLKMLCQNVDAIKIDLKSFRDDFYNKICKAELKPVLDSLKVIKSMGVWCEVVYLVIPTLNDSDAELRDASKWVFDNLGPDVPLHFSRFFKKYQLQNLPPTSVERLNTARQMAMDIGLRYVYVGNLAGNPGENTYCPKCKKQIIERHVNIVKQMSIVNGKCKWCGEKIPGVWS